MKAIYLRTDQERQGDGPVIEKLVILNRIVKEDNKTNVITTIDLDGDIFQKSMEVNLSKEDINYEILENTFRCLYDRINAVGTEDLRE